MIRFLLKGLVRDRHRSLFPILVVSIGVMLTVFAHSWFSGMINDIIDSNAKFDTGHIKIMSRSYAENKDQTPNDLALTGINDLLQQLRDDIPEMAWTPRIKFGGLIDIPDEAGETRSQSPAMGVALDFYGPGGEVERLNIQNALVTGRLPRNPGEILISDELAQRLETKVGDTATLIGSTMYGAMAVHNFTISGTLKFGMKAMDRGAMLVDIHDIRLALDMDDAAGEIVGYMHPIYKDNTIQSIKAEFNSLHTENDDEFAPVMLSLRDQNGLNDYLVYAESISGMLIFVFVGIMSLVLWNTGLIGGIRRYGEIGVRLAIGENKGGVYRSMVLESAAIGFAGSLIGSILGLALAYWIQVKGINLGDMMGNSSLLISNIVRTRITEQTYYIGFIPGLLSTVLGSMLAGIGIYKRQTAQLFKELEV
ncbi:ABC transporter permease [bacterium]|nr:ABC transporter permease [bacterium]